MPTTSIHCPQCGAPTDFRGTTVSMVCEYCSSTVVRNGADIDLIGKVSAIVDTGSPILLNSRGKFDDGNKAIGFEVVGRLQVQYQRGTWNEWYLEFADQSHGWLADSLGHYAIVRPHSTSELNGLAFERVRPGSVVTLDGEAYFLNDVRGASYKGAEGQLPFTAEPGLNFFSADFRNPEGGFATVDWGTNRDDMEPQVYVGQAVDLLDLQLSPLRRFSGWGVEREEGQS